MVIETKLISFIEEINIATPLLSQLKGVKLESLDLQNALCEKFNIDDPVELLSKNISSQKIVSILEDFNFAKPVGIEKITLNESILPLWIPKLIIEQTIKNKGEVWVIHKTDADPFPSSPHAHNYESGIKIHLGTGELFKKRELIGFLECKKLILLRKKIKNHILPILDNRCS